MKFINTIALLFGALSVVQAQPAEPLDSLYTPYLLNYLPANSPEWMAQLATPHKTNYNALVDSFNAYLMKTPGARRKSPDTKQVVNHFRRFQKAYAKFVQPDGTISLPKASDYHREIDDVNREALYARRMRAKSRGEASAANQWRVLSPVLTYDIEHKNLSPAQANIQRMRASVSNPNILYCGSETGMIFRSDDKGETWTPCAGGEWLSGEVTAVDISSTNPDRVVIGAGGVFWLSDDGGDNWRNITPVKAQYARTSAAMFHPADDNIILAGDRSQLWLSTDGGNSWELKLSGMVFDIRYSKQYPNVCYVAIEQDVTVKLYKSIDGGRNWNLLTLDSQPLISARIGLSDAPNGADYVYLWACRRNSLSQPGPLYFSGPPLLYKSVDAGNSFEVMDPVSQMESVDKNGGQGYYDLVCVASATDPETILVGIIQLYRSTDGGKNLSNVGGYYGKFDLHCDMQSIQTNGGDTWLSTDGGVIYSNDFFNNDAQPKIRGIYASEMWGFDQGWNEDVMVGGRNHNGNMSQLDRYNGASIYMRGSERPTGYVFLSNPRKVLYSDASGAVLMPDDWRDEFVPLLEYWFYPKESSQFGIGLEFDPRYAQCFYVVRGMGDEDHKTLWRTRDDGYSFNAVHTFNKPITALVVSRSNPDKIVVSTWGRIFYSLDAGESFQEYDIPEEMTNSIGYKIAIHPKNENEIWVGDGNPAGFWRTKDNGQSWDKIDEGLTFFNWEDKMEKHSIGRFFLTGNEKNAAYAIAFTMGYLNESYTTTRGRVLYRDDTTDGWIDFSEGLPKVINLNRMLPFYKNGVIRLATSNGIWERPLVDSDFAPIAQPLILNVGSGDNTNANYPRVIQLDSYSIVNQENAEWQWEITPAPLSITSYNVRNPQMTIAPNQTYDISLTIKTPYGEDTKKIEGMIFGGKSVEEGEEESGGSESGGNGESGSDNENESESQPTGVDNSSANVRDLLLPSGYFVKVGDNITFVPQKLTGKVNIKLYTARGELLYSEVDEAAQTVSTAGFAQGVYFYIATDEAGFKEAGKLVITK